EEISAELQQSKVGSILTVVIDREEPDRYIGRTEFDSPEVDPEVLVAKTRPLRPGERLEVRVDAAYPFELEATPL
ncbi:MAG: 30S ribosomal protein S12 methylthiotransferase RimO, partial [Duncaniella sp.]|nr:30S ribosomal protein S12 methylthiotransferase RimO [Duncaniella sp.]